MKTTIAIAALLANISALDLAKHPRVRNMIQTKDVADDYDAKNLWQDSNDFRENNNMMYEYFDAENLFDEVTDRSDADKEGVEEHSFIQMSNGQIKEIDPVEDTMQLISKNDKYRPSSYAESTANAKFEVTPLDIKLTKDNDEVNEFMAQQEKEDAKEYSNIQLNDSDSESDSSDDDETNVQFIPHENDTEDIVDAVTPDNYDHRHSKEWNQLVERKAKEMEDLENIQVNMKKKEKEAKEEATRKAAVDRAHQHQTRLIQLEKKEQNKKFKNPSLDFSELYANMVPDNKNVQLSALDHDNDTDDLVEVDPMSNKAPAPEPEQEVEE